MNLLIKIAEKMVKMTTKITVNKMVQKVEITKLPIPKELCFGSHVVPKKVEKL